MSAAPSLLPAVAPDPGLAVFDGMNLPAIPGDFLSPAFAFAALAVIVAGLGKLLRWSFNAK